MHSAATYGRVAGAIMTGCVPRKHGSYNIAFRGQIAGNNSGGIYNRQALGRILQRTQ